MPSFNSVVLMGHLGRDPEVKYLASGTAVADFSLAITDRVKRGESWEDETTWVDVTFFARTAEVCGEYLKKGSACLVSGRLKSESWEKDGQKRSKVKVIGDRMQMIGSKPTGDRQPQAETAGVTTGGFDDDDTTIPF